MAGFFGFGNYTKPGKGIKKDAPKKKRFFLFFEIYFRKFWKILQLNLLYVLFCIPIVTIGPATAAMSKIAHCFIQEKPVFLFSDFWDSFKKNFKQGVAVGILNMVVVFCLVQAWYFYFLKTFENSLYWILMGVVVLFTLLYFFTSYYIYLMMALVNLKLVPLIKNSFLMSFLGMRTNFLTLIFTGILVVPCVLYFPLTVPVLLILLFSTVTMITVFNSFQYIYKLVIRPYYYQNGLPDPYAEPEETEEERVFEDAT